MHHGTLDIAFQTVAILLLDSPPPVEKGNFPTQFSSLASLYSSQSREGERANSRKWQLFRRSRRNCSYKRPMGAARKASWIYRTSKGTKRSLPYTLKPSRRGKIAQMCPGGRGKATLQPYRPVYKERIFVIRGMDVAGSCCIHYWPTDYSFFSSTAAAFPPPFCALPQ